MSLPLLNLPLSLQLAVFRRANHESLCRLRRSSKRIDSFVEENRFRIACRSISNPLMLSFRLMEQEGQVSLVVSVMKTTHASLETAFTQKTLITDRNPTYSPLSDAYKQISALFIGILYLNCGCPVYDDDRHRRRYNEYVRICRGEVFPILMRLKLQCERTWTFGCPVFEEFLNLVSFDKISILRTPMTAEQRANLPIGNCPSIGMAYIEEFPNSLAQFVSNSKSLRLHFVLRGNYIQLLEDFMNEICINRQVRGNLEYFELACLIDSNREMNIPGLELIWKALLTTTTIAFQVRSNNSTNLSSVKELLSSLDSPADSLSISSLKSAVNKFSFSFSQFCLKSSPLMYLP